MSARKRIASIVTGLLIVPLLVAALWAWTVYAYSRPFDRVARADTEAHVRSICGSPDKITGAPENVAWGDDLSLQTNHGECVRLFWYFPPVAIEEYTVGFDSSGHVVSKYRYSSP